MLFINVAKPRVLTSPVGGSHIEGTSISLSCNSSAYPQATITWTHNGNVITSANNQETLLLSNLASIDSGNYQCIFGNAAGNTTSNIAVVIVYSKSL